MVKVTGLPLAVLLMVVRRPLDAADTQIDLERRRPGRNRYTTQRQEADRVEILSGILSAQQLY